MIDEMRLDQLAFHIQVKELGLEFLQAFAVRGLFAALADIVAHFAVIIVKVRGMPADFRKRVVEAEALPVAGREVDFLALICHHRGAAGRHGPDGRRASP